MKNLHAYHIVDMSPWPLLAGIGSLNLVLSMLGLFLGLSDMVFISMLYMIYIVVLWWRDVIRESTFQGFHSFVVLNGLMVGMILFIISEIFFFFSFFWAYFHFSLSSAMDVGSMWPVEGLEILEPFQVPLLNTVILLSSGVSVTLAHQSILMNSVNSSVSLMITWILGLYFLMLQLFEYYEMSFGISDSVFGSIFYMATGFHGFHVIVGTVFLFVIWVRCVSGHFSNKHHFGFEAAAWYWHFVDVVWLFLFSVVYWWGS